LSAEGFVLAGGRSSRMGRDKALAELAGRPLIAWAVDALKEAGLGAKIAGARGELGNFAEVIPDREANAGPMAGVCAALAASEAECAVILSVDMPVVPASLIEYLVWDSTMTGRTVTLASANGFPQTFPAVVRREALAVLEQELRGGRSGCFAGFSKAAASAGETVRVIAAEALAQTGQVAHRLGIEPVRWFHNVNSEAELARAEKWLSSRVLQHGSHAPGIS
jgi:molybdenum cofactor guanylyltransferase